jgi:hypothetical protein
MIAIQFVRHRRLTATIASVMAFATGDGATAASAQPASANCETEVVTLERQAADLPRIEVASPTDRPVLCITIETLMAFAGRLKIHVAQCPNSSFAAAATDWEKARVDFSRQFTQNRCRRTLPN